MTDTQHDIERLILAIYQPSPEARAAALDAFAIHDDPQRWEALVRAVLPAEDWFMEQLVNLLVSHFAQEAVPYLVALLHHLSVAVRCRVIGLIAQQGGVAAVPLLLPMLADAEATVRQAVIDVLVTLRRPFLQAFAKAEPSLQQAAIPHLVERLYQVPEWPKTVETKALISIGTPSVLEEMRAQLPANYGYNLESQIAAVWVAIAGPAAFEPLLSLLTVDALYVQHIVATGIWFLRDQRGIPHLLAMLEEVDDWSLHEIVVRALGTLRATPAVPAVVRYLNQQQTRSKADQALWTLRRIGTAEALAAIADWQAHWQPPPPPPRPTMDETLTDLRSTDPDRFQQGWLRLSKAKAAQGPIVDILVMQTRAPNATLRHHAIRAMRTMQTDPRCRDATLLALRDPDLGVQLAAVECLTPNLTQTPVVRTATLGADGREALLTLLDSLDDSPLVHKILMALFIARQAVEVKRVARFASAYPSFVGSILALSDDPAAVEPLLVALARDPTAHATADILTAVGRWGDKRAIPAITLLVQHPRAEIRLQALQTLGQLGYTESWDVVVAALSDEEPAVRLAAMAALGSIGDGRAVAVLEPLLHDSHFAVPIGVAHALHEIGTPEALAAVEQWQREHGDQP